MAWRVSDLWDTPAQDKALARALTPLHRDAAAAAYRGARDVGVSAEVANARALADGLAQRAAGINATTRGELEQTLAEGARRGYTPRQVADGVPADGYGGVAGVFARARGARTDAIVATETAMAYNLGSAAAYRDGGLDAVEVVDGESDPACAGANGSVWSLDEAEANPLQHPHCVRQFMPISRGGGATRAQLDE